MGGYHGHSQKQMYQILVFKSQHKCTALYLQNVFYLPSKISITVITLHCILFLQDTKYAQIENTYSNILYLIQMNHFECQMFILDLAWLDVQKD